MSDEMLDIVICGAGTAGASAAYHLARMGLKVLVCEGRHRHLAGAQWINGIPLWMFERAGLPWPRSPELRENSPHFSLRTPQGKQVMALKTPFANIDMRLLNRRLLDMAEQAGAQIWDKTEVVAPLVESGRVVGVKYRHGQSEGELRAHLVIDALNGKRVLINELAESAQFPSVQAFEMCDAAQQIRKISDLEKAGEYLATNQANDREVLSFLAIEGGWSVLNVQLNLQQGEVEFLSGAIAEAHRRSGPKIIQDFVSEHVHWVGDITMAGRGKIPLRLCYEKPYVPGMILLGGAACMIFPIHGSGVGSSMIAAKLLAEAVSECGAHQHSELGLLFKKKYDSELGRLQKFYGALQRATQKLSSQQAQWVLQSGLVSRSLIEAGFSQKWPSLKFSMEPLKKLLARMGR